jgi:hypothetical protein
VLAQRKDGRRLVQVGDYDLTGVLEGDEKVTSALPDFHGNVWFVTKQGGLVGVLNPRSRKIQTVRIGEQIENSFAIDRDATYIVSDKRMYRFSLRHGRPHVGWSVVYANSGVVKPGQVNAGSGTTPTLMAAGYVAIADNADPMNVVVYRKAATLKPGEQRTVCAVPVFSKGASASENSLNTSGNALFVENNYGYRDPFNSTAAAAGWPGRTPTSMRRPSCRSSPR